MLNSIVSSLIGGLMALCGVIIAETYHDRTEKSKWIRETRADLYFDLITQLEAIDIPIIIDHDKKISVNVEEINNRIEILSDYLSTNAGKIIVFVPNSTYSELMRLRAELYKCSQDNQIDMMHIKESEQWKNISHAKSIILQLKNELLK